MVIGVALLAVYAGLMTAATVSLVHRLHALSHDVTSGRTSHGPRDQRP